MGVKMKEIKNASVVGMGALGLLYGNLIQENLGKEAVDFVMDEDRVKKYRQAEFKINGEKREFRLTRTEDAKKSDLVIVAVKYTGLESAFKSIEKCVGENTVIISVLNGISSEEILAEKFGKEKIVYSVAQGMDAMRSGHEVKYTKEGELRIGVANGGKEENLKALEAFFDKAKIHYTEEADILKRMWNKFMLNVGINQTCMAFGASYSEVLGSKELTGVFMDAMKEVMECAKKKGIVLGKEDMNKWISIIKTFDPNGTPSMGQDRLAKRKSEVELFSGTVIRLGEETGTPVPTNKMLYEKIRQIEAEY